MHETAEHAGLDSRQQGVNVNNVTRAIHILEMLDGARRGLNISEIARRLDIP
jgi:hypothetical protein